MVPSETEFSSAMLLKPAYQTSSPIVIDVEISDIGKKIELYQTVFSQACLCLSFISVSLSFLKVFPEQKNSNLQPHF